MKPTSQSPQAVPNPHKNSVSDDTLIISAEFIQRLAILSRKLGYVFNDLSLPKLALTHRSFDSKKNYERLEFLGDALLGMIVGEALYHRYPTQNEAV